MSAALCLAVSCAVVLSGAVGYGIGAQHQAMRDCLQHGACSPLARCRLAPPPPDRSDWILRDDLDPCDDPATLAHYATGGAP